MEYADHVAVLRYQRPELAAELAPLRTLEHVLGWLSDPAAYAAVRQELAALRDRVAAPGACESAAQYLLDVLKQKPEMRRRAAA